MEMIDQNSPDEQQDFISDPEETAVDRDIADQEDYPATDDSDFDTEDDDLEDQDDLEEDDKDDDLTI